MSNRSSSRMPAKASERAALVRPIRKEKTDFKKGKGKPAPRPKMPEPVPDVEAKDEETDPEEEDEVASLMSEDEEKEDEPQDNKPSASQKKQEEKTKYGKERRSKGVKTQASASSEDPFLVLYETAKDVGYTKKVGTEPNYYRVNCYQLMHVLHICHVIMNDNEHVAKYFKWFAPPVMFHYITILVIIQVLRAQISVKKLQNIADGKFLRAFLRTFPPESLMIPGPLVPFFNEIAGIILEDPKFGNVAPMLPKNGATLADGTAPLSSNRTFPWIRHLVGYVIGFTGDSMYDTDDHTTLFYVKNTSAGAPGRTFMGVDYDTRASATQAVLEQLYTPGNCYGFDFNQVEDLVATANESSRYRHAGSKRAALAQRFSATLTHFRALTGAEESVRASDLCLMSERDTWFAEYVSHAAKFCAYFKGSKNLSQIDVTTGLNRTMKGENTQGPARVGMDAFPATGVTNVLATNGSPNLSAKYYTNRGEISEVEIRRAIMTRIMCKEQGAAAGAQYSGPFFSFQEAANEVLTDEQDVKALYTTLIESKLYITKPSTD